MNFKNRIKNLICLLIIHLFNLMPIKKNKLFFFSYYGSNYGCNPKYISEYIVKHYPKGRFDVVWAFNDPESKMYMEHIRKVKTMSLKYFYELCTSKIVITNFRTTDLFVKRKNQYYIQTWHSSLRIKQIEKDIADALPADYVKMAKKDSFKCDLLLSGCNYSTDILKRAFWYDGEIFEHGTPRNDVLFQRNVEKKNKVLDKLTISQEKKVLLYAPTFRKGDDSGVYDLDYKQLSRVLGNKFGKEWVILVKLHPHLISKSNQLVYNDNVIDVTAFDDIQELLLASDVLISDYSSLIFDFAITKRPCFLYVPDLKKYISQDRKLYFDMMELPFISATSNKDLFEKIEGFHDEQYQQNAAKFLKKVGSYEGGNANNYLMKRIESICYNEKRSDVYEAI